jgi:hypothetical protein
VAANAEGVHPDGGGTYRLARSHVLLGRAEALVPALTMHDEGLVAPTRCAE